MLEMKAQALQRKCYLLGKQQAGWKHAIPKLILLISSVIQDLSPFGGKKKKKERNPVARGTADFRGKPRK